MKIFYRPPFPPPPPKEKKNPQQVATTHLYCKLRCTEFQHTILVSGVWFTIAQTRRTVGVTGDLFFTIYPLKSQKEYSHITFQLHYLPHKLRCWIALVWRLRYLSMLKRWKFVSIFRRLFKNGRYSLGSWKIKKGIGTNQHHRLPLDINAQRIPLSTFIITFCDFSATISTNSKSYIPSATSYIWLTSTRKRTYLRASSDVTRSVSVVFTGLAWMKIGT